MHPYCIIQMHAKFVSLSLLCIREYKVSMPKDPRDPYGQLSQFTFFSFTWPDTTKHTFLRQDRTRFSMVPPSFYRLPRKRKAVRGCWQTTYPSTIGWNSRTRSLFRRNFHKQGIRWIRYVSVAGNRSYRLGIKVFFFCYLPEFIRLEFDENPFSSKKKPTCRRSRNPRRYALVYITCIPSFSPVLTTASDSRFLSSLEWINPWTHSICYPSDEGPCYENVRIPIFHWNQDNIPEISFHSFYVRTINRDNRAIFLSLISDKYFSLMSSLLLTYNIR